MPLVWGHAAVSDQVPRQLLWWVKNISSVFQFVQIYYEPATPASFLLTVVFFVLFCTIFTTRIQQEGSESKRHQENPKMLELP